MKKLILSIGLLLSLAVSAAVVFYGSAPDGRSAAQFLENILYFQNSGQQIEASGDRLVHIDSNSNKFFLNGAGKRTNLLLDPSFESGVAELTASTCTLSSESSVVMAATDNVNSAKLACAASTGSATVDKTTGSEYASTQMYGGCWIKTSAAGVKFHVRSNGANILDVDVDNTDTWRWYALNFVAGTTSVGYQVEASASITDDIYVDECFLGASDETYQVGIASDAVEYAPTHTGLGIPSANSAFYWREGQFLHVYGTVDSGTVTAAPWTISLPSGLNLDSSILNADRDGKVGEARQSGTAGSQTINNASIMLDIYYVTGTSTTSVYVTDSNNGSGGPVYLDRNASSIMNSGARLNFNFKVPIQGWTAGQDALSSANLNETVTKTLSADVSTNGTTLSDLTFTDLVIGGRYKVILNARLVLSSASAHTTAIDVTHDGGVIDSAEVSGGSQTTVKYSTVREFTASATTLTFVTRGMTSGAVAGDGTQSETFAQLRRIDGQFNATLRDVVKSPGSSNGKPILASATVSDAGVISKNTLLSGNCTPSSPNMTCSFISNLFAEEPNCAIGMKGSSATEHRISAISSTGFNIQTYTSAGGNHLVSFMVVCHGLAP